MVHLSKQSFLALTLFTMTHAGCDDGRDAGPATRVASDDVAGDDEESTDDQECTSLMPEGGLQATPPNQALAFDFATGNGAIEVIIPSAVPAIYGTVAGPGDATIVLRYTTTITNGWFDALAPYHPTAVGVYSNLGRRPASESVDQTNQNIAAFYSSYRIFNWFWPQFKPQWDAMMTSVGLDPDDDHESTTDAIGIGNSAGNAVIAGLSNDGFNQLGFDDGRTYNPQPFSDYTGYAPVNTAYELKHKRRWQPRLFTTPYGIARIQHFVTPQYALTRAYSYDDVSEFSVPPPAHTFGTQAMYTAQADEVIAASADLTDEEKLLAELFDDKIRSLGFSSVFASLSNGHNLMQWVHYDFLANMAAWDTGIAVWQEKTKYDAVRPFSAIRHIYGDSEITAWGGPGQGTVSIAANEWRPYLNTADHPEYPSGSANFCAAHAQASRLFFGTDNLNWTVPFPAGSSVHEPGVTPAVDTNLFFPTWTDFQEKCALSRFNGGVHFMDAVEESSMGDAIGTLAYQFVMAHINGTPP